MRKRSRWRCASIFAVGLVLGAGGAALIQRAQALPAETNTTTSRYQLQLVGVTAVATGEPAGEVEAAKWLESGEMGYSGAGRSVSPQVAHAPLTLYREAE